MMGIHSVIGIVLRDLSVGIMEELRATFDNRGKESLKEIFVRFKDRIFQILADIKAKWKDILKGSLESAITSFLSNIVTFVINIFATTLKRIVRVIRAGFASLVQAIKILVNPPKDMPKEDVAYEALKVLVAGIIGALSLGLTEGIAELLSKIPPLAAILGLPIPIVGGTLGDAISITLSAIVGGLLTTIALYYMDKWRSQSKEDRLQIQIMTKSGEIVQYKIAQTWFVLKDGYQAVMSIANHTQESLLKTQSIITQSGLEAKNALDETDVKIAELKRLFNS